MEKKKKEKDGEVSMKKIRCPADWDHDKQGTEIKP